MLLVWRGISVVVVVVNVLLLLAEKSFGSGVTTSLLAVITFSEPELPFECSNLLSLVVDLEIPPYRKVSRMQTKVWSFADSPHRVQKA